jgi:hypothetical protein
MAFRDEDDAYEYFKQREIDDVESIHDVLLSPDLGQLEGAAPRVPVQAAETGPRAGMSAFWANVPVRFSHLKAYGRSPAHGKHARLAAKDDPTYAMERGSAVDAILFGHKKVVCYPGPVRRGKEYDAFAAQNVGNEILGKTEYDKANRMADAVRASKLAEPLLNGVRQDTLLFNWMGMACRTTPDVRGPDFLTELKTAQTSDPSRFIWHARRMAYHAQMRFQEYGCEKLHMHIRHHYIVCVESEAPHPVTVFHVEPEALDEADKLLMLWAERLKNCELSDNYPPYVECLVPLVWPKDIEYEFGEQEAA